MPVVGTKIVPKDAHALISGACEDTSFHSKRDFAGVIKLRILMWGSALGYLGGPNVITRVLTREAGWSE